MLSDAELKKVANEAKAEADERDIIDVTTFVARKVADAAVAAVVPGRPTLERVRERILVMWVAHERALTEARLVDRDSDRTRRLRDQLDGMTGPLRLVETMIQELDAQQPAATAEPSLTERVERLERTLAETVASVEYLSGKVPDAAKLAVDFSKAVESIVVAHIEGAARLAAARVGGPVGAAFEAMAEELLK